MSNSRLTSIRQRIEAGRENLRRWRQAEPPPMPKHKPKEFKYLKPRDLRSMKNMLFAARAIVEGYYSGRHRSRFKGNAPEFVDYRQYNPGDELRSIDWKAYARTDRHYIKLQVQSYYSPAAQDACNKGGAAQMPSVAGSYRIRWAFIRAPSI